MLAPRENSQCVIVTVIARGVFGIVLPIAHCARRRGIREAVGDIIDFFRRRAGRDSGNELVLWEEILSMVICRARAANHAEA